MKAKPSSREKQSHLLYQELLDQLNPEHPLLALAKKLPWDMFEEEFAEFYASVGRPAKLVRLMVGLLLLKQIENLHEINEKREPTFAGSLWGALIIH